VTVRSAQIERLAETMSSVALGDRIAATTIAMPIVAIDGQPIGEGKPGPVTMVLRRRFHEMAALS
jgi:branched-subunit amino acid aminotransferase/4-amino-4-deoxychorismate lyase